MVHDGEVVKRYFSRGKFVNLIKLDNEMYCFKIDDKCNAISYYSSKAYDTLESCESDSYKVAKGGK